MKISKSKQELARIISENGGWRGGAEWAAQDACGTLNSYQRKPVYSRGCTGFGHGGGYFHKICAAAKIKNWHQTILSRAEYFHLYPAPAADGWIEWKGMERPVGADDLVDVKYANGTVELGFGASGYAWNRKCEGLRIIAYRLHKPEQAKPEFCKSVMRSIPEPEKIKELAEIMGCNEDIESIISVAKSNEDWIKSLTSRDSSLAGSIEQLAADYRNKLGYANMKQDEADKANMDSDAALSELEAAIASIGFAITPLGSSKQEPELVIADWRDLRLGDVIWVGKYDDHESGEHVVIELEDRDYGCGYAVKAATSSGVGRWIDTTREWSFIRHP